MFSLAKLNGVCCGTPKPATSTSSRDISVPVPTTGSEPLPVPVPAPVPAPVPGSAMTLLLKKGVCSDEYVTVYSNLNISKKSNNELIVDGKTFWHSLNLKEAAKFDNIPITQFNGDNFINGYKVTATSNMMFNIRKI